MRTRKEQVEELARLFSWPHHPDDGHAQNAEDMILEAERRAEQRVRDEIGRDSERLDWLEKLPFADVGRLPNGWEICINNVRHWDMQPTLREAIDAAMEGGK